MKKHLPELIFIVGHTGVGKTTYGKSLSKKYKLAFLDKDTVDNLFTEELLIQNGLKISDRKSDFYLNKIKPIEYNTLLRIINDNLELGVSVVTVAPFTSIGLNPNYISDNIRVKCSVKVIEIRVPEFVHKHRISKRNRSFDSYILDNWESYYRGLTPWKCTWNTSTFSHVIIET